MGLWHERRKIAAARFCPWCGVDSLVRYDAAECGEKGTHSKGIEFWCTTCGSSFKLDRSNRYRQAVELLADHRKMR